MDETSLSPLTAEERKLLRLLRELDYGEVSVTVENGSPVLVDELRRSVMLDH